MRKETFGNPGNQFARGSSEARKKARSEMAEELLLSLMSHPHVAIGKERLPAGTGKLNCLSNFSPRGTRAPTEESSAPKEVSLPRGGGGCSRGSTDGPDNRVVNAIPRLAFCAPILIRMFFRKKFHVNYSIVAVL